MQVLVTTQQSDIYNTFTGAFTGSIMYCYGGEKAARELIRQGGASYGRWVNGMHYLAVKISLCGV